MARDSHGSRRFLVGRDRELAILHECLTATLDGQGRLVLISGEAGIGKTALVCSLVRFADSTRLPVLAGHCYDRTETPPYGPWMEIAQRVGRLSDAPEVAVPRFSDAANQAEFYAQIRSFLAALTAERPVVLVLEDLHWADDASLDLLRFLAHSVAELPLLIVATYRDEDVGRGHPLTSTIPSLVREAPTHRLGLRPLDASAAQELVRASFGLDEPIARRLATYVMARTEGNALFLTELLRSLDEEGLFEKLASGSEVDLSDATPVPWLLQQIVEDRLSRLGDQTAALLAVAAVIGEEVPLSIWQAVTRVEEESLLIAAEQAEAAHLVTASPEGDGIRFTHALIRDVLREDVPALRRRRMHRQVADALIDLSLSDPDAVAYHLKQAGDDRATEWFVRAGERAEDMYALVTASERYETAFTLLDAQQGDPAERGWLRLIAAILRRKEDGNQAAGWVEEAVQLAETAGDPSLVARAQALAAHFMGYAGDPHESIPMATAALDMIDQLPPGNGKLLRREQQIDKVINRGTIVASLAYCGAVAEARRRGEAYLARSEEAVTEPGDAGAIADANYGLALAYALQGEPALAQRSYVAAVTAHRALDLHVVGFVGLCEQLILVVLPYQADDLDERERMAEAAVEVAQWMLERGVHRNANLAGYARLPLLMLEGKWHEARDVLEQRDLTDLNWLSRAHALYAGMLARVQGDTETAWRCVNEPSGPWGERADAEPGRTTEISVQLQLQLLAAELALDADDLPAARAWLDLHRRWLDFMDATLGRAEHAILEAELCRATGNGPLARHHAEQALADATTPRQPLSLMAAHRMLGILDTDDGAYAAADDHFVQALGLADACQAPYERALTQLARAELATAQGDYSTAAGMLDEVRDTCTQLGARPALFQADRLATRITQESRSRNSRPNYPAGLTTREVEVLRLVAAGQSNAEIAERLYLSTRTVKAHVANIYSKIDVHNRVGATQFAIDHGLV